MLCRAVPVLAVWVVCAGCAGTTPQELVTRERCAELDDGQYDAFVVLIEVARDEGLSKAETLLSGVDGCGVDGECIACISALVDLVYDQG